MALTYWLLYKSGNMEDDQILAVKDIQDQLGDSFNFDTELRGMLFGKGSTMIIRFRESFAYYTDKEAEGSDLENLMNSYLERSPPWTLLSAAPPSAQWDVSYFFLKFKDPQSSNVMVHWKLPPDMRANYDELQASAQTPEAQLAIAQYRQVQLALATNAMNMNLQLVNLMAQGTAAIVRAAQGN